jgi:bifunctional non-homologous end joining protein LigD
MKNFVVQEHHAVRAGLHYDFRLEYGGVLKSWACKKEPPTEVGEKVLAIETTDHDLSYLTFEGEIYTKYGKGTVEIWDIGEYEMVSEGRGSYLFILHGEKMKGRYSLVRMEKKKWLLSKTKSS